MSQITLIERLFRRLITVVSGGRVLIVDDTGPVQFGQINFGPNQLVDNVPMPQHFGFTSNPPPGSDVVAGCMSGDRSKATALSSNSQQYRKKNLRSGASAQYDMNGNYCLMDDTGIYVHSNGLPITIDGATSLNITTGSVNVTGSVSVSDNLSVGSGATGTFMTLTGNVVTVTDGIVTSIV